MIEGGDAVNQISAHAIGHIDVRVSKPEQIEELEHKIEEVCSTSDVVGTKIDLTGDISIGWPLSAMIAGKILLKIGFRSTALIGATSLVIGTVCYNVLPWLSTPAIAAVGSFFIGMGLGFMTTTFIVSIQSAVEWKVRGEATSLNLFMRQLGGSVGVAFLGGLLNYRIKQVLESSQDHQ